MRLDKNDSWEFVPFSPVLSDGLQTFDFDISGEFVNP